MLNAGDVVKRAMSRGTAPRDQPKEARQEGRTGGGLATIVEESTGTLSAQRSTMPVKEERKEEARPGMAKANPRAKAKGFTSWGSQVLKKTLGQDRRDWTHGADGRRRRKQIDWHAVKW